MIVSGELMTKRKDMYNKFSEGEYPEYVPPGNFRTESNPNDSIKDVREGFQTATATGPAPPGGGGGGGGGSSGSSGYKVEKCFRFDPEQVGPDGIIVLDASGTPLKNIQISRDAEKQIWLGAISHPGSVSLTSVEKGIVYSFIGICIFAIVLGCILTFLYTKKYTVTYNSVLTRSRSIGYFSVQGLALFIFGFGIGMSAIPATCPKPDCSDASKGPLIATAVLIGILFIYAIGNL
jgi:hypothetical protein